MSILHAGIVGSFVQATLNLSDVGLMNSEVQRRMPP